MKFFMVALCAATIFTFPCFAEEKPTPAATQSEQYDRTQAPPNAAPGATAAQTPGAITSQAPAATAAQTPGITVSQAPDKTDAKAPDAAPSQIPESASPHGSDTSSPAVEIRQTIKEELKSDNGTLLCVIDYSRPVFTGSSKADKKIEQAYVKEEKRVIKKANQLKRKAEEEYARASTAGEKFIGPAYYQVKAVETSDKHNVISFLSQGSEYEFGAHPVEWREGNTFSLKTGKKLRVDDVLAVNKNNAADIIFREFNLVFGSKMIEGSEKSAWEQSGLNAVFALQNDGVHIYYDQDTIYHAFGIPDLIIPYSRTDLVKAPFAN
jgi:hypothetical protein